MKFKQAVPFLLACLLAAGCAPHGQYRFVGLQVDTPYLIVYGKENCSGCQRFKQDLDRQRVRYVFKDIDDARVWAELSSRMEKADLASNSFPIPVVEVNGELAVYPSMSDTLDRYRRSAGQK